LARGGMLSSNREGLYGAAVVAGKLEAPIKSVKTNFLLVTAPYITYYDTSTRLSLTFGPSER